MLGDEPSVFETQGLAFADRLRLLEELGSGVHAARAHLLCDLTRASLLLEELAARLAHAALGVGRARGVREHRVDYLRRAYESLLVNRDDFEHRALCGRARELDDGFVRRGDVERDRFLRGTTQIRARGEVGEHGRRRLGRGRRRRERGRLLRGESLVGRARYTFVRVRAQRDEEFE